MFTFTIWRKQGSKSVHKLHVCSFPRKCSNGFLTRSFRIRERTPDKAPKTSAWLWGYHVCGKRQGWSRDQIFMPSIACAVRRMLFHVSKAIRFQETSLRIAFLHCGRATALRWAISAVCSLPFAVRVVLLTSLTSKRGPFWLTKGLCTADRNSKPFQFQMSKRCGKRFQCNENFKEILL